MTKLSFSSLSDVEQSFAVLDLIPDTHAWAKDTAGVFVFGNRLFFERFGFSSAQDLIGKCDFDLAPMHMAKSYRDDDDAVLAGGMVVDRLELIRGKGESVEWFLTSKWPIHDLHDHIIGTLGMSRHLNRTERKAIPFTELHEPINYIDQHFGSDISVQALANACNISISALERRFKKHLKLTPHQYIIEVRLSNARQLLLDTGKPIGVIAAETGFADHSHFTRAFSKRYRVTPKTARKTEGGS